MEAIKIRDDVYWVGAIDWNLRYFHGYVTPRGSTYNAYLIIDDKITLIDTAKEPFSKEIISRISKIVDPSKIEYLISNHVEPDHSGCIPAIMELAPNATIVTSSPNGEKGLRRHYKKDYKFMSVKTGDELNIGKRTLKFIGTPMIHWPDNMVTYSAYDKILFSNDSFGQHYASTERFDEDADIDKVMEEAKIYYANIVMPYGMQVKGALEAVKGLEIEAICPSHGVVIRKSINRFLENYNKWSECQNDGSAVIVYDTMWGTTEKMAKAVCEAFEKKGISVRMYKLSDSHMSQIMPYILTAKYICVGSPTLNNNMLPTVSAFLTYLKGLLPKNKLAFAFGSYGWSGQSVEQINTILEECKYEILAPFSRIQYIPDDIELVELTGRLAGVLHE